VLLRFPNSPWERTLLGVTAALRAALPLRNVAIASERAGWENKAWFLFLPGSGSRCHAVPALLLDSPDPGWAQPSALPLESMRRSRYSGEKGHFTAMGPHLDTDPPQSSFSFGSARPRLPERAWSLGRAGLPGCSHGSPCVTLPSSLGRDQGPWRAPDAGLTRSHI